jgi:hypothetical protein
MGHKEGDPIRCVLSRKRLGTTGSGSSGQGTFCLESKVTDWAATSVYFRGGGSCIDVLFSVGGWTFLINAAIVPKSTLLTRPRFWPNVRYIVIRNIGDLS